MIACFARRFLILPLTVFGTSVVMIADPTPDGKT
jgi:hypothetical protein